MYVSRSTKPPTLRGVTHPHAKSPLTLTHGAMTLERRHLSSSDGASSYLTLVT